jgi:hypothetical protein
MVMLDYVAGEPKRRRNQDHYDSGIRTATYLHYSGEY